MSWLQENKVQYINDWPPNSPDLNPVEHVWHFLKLRVSLYERMARNIDELWERVDFEWNKLDRDACRSYIDSMPDRIAAVTLYRHDLDVCIYKSGTRDSINDKTTTFLLKATRQSTHKAYNNGWKVWSNWCRSQDPKLDPEEYNPNNVLQFLVDNQHFSYQYLNGLRSSIASVFKHIHPHQKPIASQPNISRFFTAKRKTEIRIPTTNQLETWDINLLIQFIKDKLTPTAELNLQQLQLKVILLTCINTMGRPRSDVGRLQHRDVKFITSEISNDLEGVVLHIRTPKESQIKTSKLGMVDDKEVCLVSTLFLYSTSHQASFLCSYGDRW
ncbi:hypothetical protein G6F16_012953 [Rhizopus arrhizus]|nr:hypothetical protein G6F21_012823 [Rhizopus arrhizus]KAG0804213.1 hypothetical protein G6F20_012880 [Rhizopus arrhizus]KAG0815962.1 hypothetical protein G6F19_012948 [Rhizopus arrhizus]KAG0817049.1 hypothetical protein G6F18_012954 [Rhizopus arrhizus]KAG0861881.1 hypothetical protein G6F16_012953 [Rhizopus arrhizus]